MVHGGISLDRDQCIITVYCLVREQYQTFTASQPLRHGGFAPALTDAEVLTIERCGEYFPCASDTAISAYFRQQYPAWFPHLPDRTRFVRQAANLAPLAARMQQRLTVLSGQAEDSLQIIDTLPVPVCVLTRAPRDRCLRLVADYGYCAAKQQRYYGFKLGLRIARSGMIIHAPLLPARPHDVTLLDDVIDQFRGTLAADKGFLDAERQARLAERLGVTLITPRRKNMAAPPPSDVLRTCMRLRKRVETVGSQLTGWFGHAHIRVRDLWHFAHRLIRKILAHIIGVFLNLPFHRRPLDLDGLLAAQLSEKELHIR